MITRLRRYRERIRGFRWQSERARSLFFNRAFVTGALAVAILGALTNSRGFLLLGVLVLIAALTTSGWNRLSLSGLTCVCTVDHDRLHPGESGEITIELVNEKAIPVPWLSLDLEMSDEIQPTTHETTPAGKPGVRVLHLRSHLGPYERIRWRIPARFPHRGAHQIGPITLRASDPLGFFANRLDLLVEERVVVYPRLFSVGALNLPHQYLVGDRRVPRHLLSDPLRIAGVRDHRPEDPLHSIHWKATARQGKLQVRVTEPSSMLHLAIMLNIDTFNNYWEGLDVEASEAAIDAAASLAMWALDQRYGVGLSSNGIAAFSDQPLRIPHGRGDGQRTRVLEGLARLTPYSSTGFTRLLAQEAQRLPSGSTVMIVTTLLSDGLPEIMQRLIGSGHRVVLVPVRDCPAPALRGLTIRRLLEPHLERDGEPVEETAAHA